MRRAAKTDRNQAEIVAARGIWRCEGCGKEERATVHRMRNRFCSMDCARPAATASRFVTAQNKREALAKEIAAIYESGMAFKDVAQALGLSRPWVSLLSKEFGIKRRSARVSEVCGFCGAEFQRYQSSSKQFCSYECHIKSGGAKRAGDAAVMAAKKYGAKKDANHKEVFAMIGALTAVKDLSSAGFGVPDGLAWVNNGWQLFDVKNPKSSYGKRGLNARQKTWADDWRGGPVYLIYTVEEAEQFARGNLAEIKRFPNEE